MLVLKARLSVRIMTSRHIRYCIMNWTHR